MWGQTYYGDSRGRGSETQTQISTTDGSSLGHFSYNVITARQSLVKIIVLAELPFVFAENDFFKTISKIIFDHNLEDF